MLRQTWRQRSFRKTQPHTCERVETHACIASGSELAMTTPWPLFQPEPHLEGVIGGLKHSAAEVGGIGEGGGVGALPGGYGGGVQGPAPGGKGGMRGDGDGGGTAGGVGGEGGMLQPSTPYRRTYDVALGL